MSSKAKSMADKIKTADDTKSMSFRIDITLDGNSKTVYMIVSGIPSNLPVEMEDSVKVVAKQQFSQVIKAGGFLEVYNPGKTAKDETPVFFNLAFIKELQVTDITKID